MKAIELHYESHNGSFRYSGASGSRTPLLAKRRAASWQIGSRHVRTRGALRSFSSFLVSKGFVVCANDHVGHGKSASDKESLGHMPLRNGAEVLIEDVHELRKMMQGRYGEEVPFVMFGHSMGSL